MRGDHQGRLTNPQRGVWGHREEGRGQWLLLSLATLAHCPRSFNTIRGQVYVGSGLGRGGEQENIFKTYQIPLRKHICLLSGGSLVGGGVVRSWWGKRGRGDRTEGLPSILPSASHQPGAHQGWEGSG